MDSHNLVICPVYNEEPSLVDFYQDLRREYKGCVLFVDDGSIDKSREILQGLTEEKVFLISHRQRSGYGAALISGFRFAQDKGFKRVVTIDADRQHNPAHIPRFFSALLEYEVVLGSRYIRIDKYLEVPRERLYINRYIAGLFKVLFAVNITDPFCGFRGYRHSFLAKICLQEAGYGLGIELLLELFRIKASFIEIPVEAIYSNPMRKFGAGLDDPRRRLLYYLAVVARKRKEIGNEKKIFSGQPPS